MLFGVGKAPGCGGAGPSYSCAGVVLVGEGLFGLALDALGAGVGPGNGAAPGFAAEDGKGKLPKPCPGPEMGEVGQSVLSFVGL